MHEIAYDVYYGNIAYIYAHKRRKHEDGRKKKNVIYYVNLMSCLNTHNINKSNSNGSERICMSFKNRIIPLTVNISNCQLIYHIYEILKCLLKIYLFLFHFLFVCRFFLYFLCPPICFQIFSDEREESKELEIMQIKLYFAESFSCIILEKYENFL